jgi:hypothetical protein
MIRREFLSTTLGGGAALALSADPTARNIQREVLAFYYGWYANPDVSGQWAHWPEGIANHPRFGRYDCHDPKVIARTMDQGKAAGITGLIVSWWRPGDFQDRGLPPLLAAAENAGLKITIYYEAAKPRPPQAPSQQATEEDLLDILHRYGGHPAWLRVANRPVVFVYTRALKELSLSGWARVIAAVNRRYPGGACFLGDQISPEAAKVFNGIHAYNPTAQTSGKSIGEIRAWARAEYPKWIAVAGRKISCLTVIPGYNDTKLDRPAPRPTTDRHAGETYRVLWQEAICGAAGLDSHHQLERMARRHRDRALPGERGSRA